MYAISCIFPENPTRINKITIKIIKFWNLKKDISRYKFWKQILEFSHIFPYMDYRQVVIIHFIYPRTCLLDSVVIRQKRYIHLPFSLLIWLFYIIEIVYLCNTISCLFVYSGVQKILCCIFVLFFFVLGTLCCQFRSIVHFWLLLRYYLRLCSPELEQTTNIEAM